MKNPEINICEHIESKMNEIIDMVNKMDSAIETDPLHSELRILDWILYQVCSNEINLRASRFVLSHAFSLKVLAVRVCFSDIPNLNFKL